jgi:hypothetical protein
MIWPTIGALGDSAMTAVGSAVPPTVTDFESVPVMPMSSRTVGVTTKFPSRDACDTLTPESSLPSP